MLDYRYIKAFILASKYESFALAAKELEIAPSALARQIKLLENSLGTELILRTKKKILLTEKGLSFYKLAILFEKNVHSLFSIEESGPINIGACDSIILDWFTKIISSQINDLNRSVNFQIQSQLELKTELTEGKLDLVLTKENIQNEFITSIKIYQEKFILISTFDIDPKNLHEETWIVFKNLDFLHKLSKQKNHKIIQVDSYNSLLNLVSEGCGVAIIPELILTKENQFKVYHLSETKRFESNIYYSILKLKKLPKYLQNLIYLIENLSNKS